MGKRLTLSRNLKLRLYIKLQKLLKLQHRISFSQFGEDISILHILFTRLNIRNGFYIDVGCNRPIHCSNTFNLYLREWRGLTIDLNE